LAIDLHSHVFPRTTLDAMLASPDRFGARAQSGNGIKVRAQGEELFWDNNGKLSGIERELYDIDAKIEAMDRMRLQISAISVAPPTYLYWLDAQAGLEASRLHNDGIAEMVDRYPSRLRGMATLPMQDPDAAIEELHRVVREHKFKAVEIGTSIEGELLAAPKFRKVLKAIQSCGCFVFAHPYACMAKGGMEGYQLFNTIGFPLDEVIMVAHLMFSGALDDMPGLNILIAHAGGYVPYQIGRFECAHANREAVRVHSPTSPKEQLRRFYYDTITHDPKALRFLINLVGPDRVTIGSDNPFDMGYADPLAELDKVPGLTTHERDCLCHRTARYLLRES
jgi:aminocarboxymuconate-semialdehyde decarboxylase